MNRTFDSGFKYMQQHSAKRGHTGTAGHHDDGVIIIFAQIKRTQWSFDANQGFFLEFVKYNGREIAAGDMANLEFQEFIVMRWVGQGECPAASILENKVNILPSKKL